MTPGGLCEFCRATVGAYEHAVPGGYCYARKLWICDACAAKHGIERTESAAMKELREFYGKAEPPPRTAEAVRDELAKLGIGKRKRRRKKEGGAGS